MTEAIRISMAAARVNADMSQEQVAKALNVSNATVCAWENYKSPITVEMAQKISNLYGLPMECIKFIK